MSKHMLMSRNLQLRNKLHEPIYILHRPTQLYEAMKTPISDCFLSMLFTVPGI